MIHIIDTGPLFKFLVTDCVPQLLSAIGNRPIHLPEAVEYEVKTTPERHRQFAMAPDKWRRFPARFQSVISDEPTGEIEAACLAIYGVDFEEMYAQAKDRGEKMAIIHGVVRAQNGHHVVLVCDDDGGATMVKKQARILSTRQMRGLAQPGGRLQHASTLTVLRWAIENGSFRDRGDFRKKYERMAALDEALNRDVRETGLLDSPPWP